MSRLTGVTPAHCLLRRATGRLHCRLEQKSLLATLLSPGITLQPYLAVMQALERAYGAIDHVLVKTGALCPSGMPAYLPRVPSIRHDLQALGASSGDGLEQSCFSLREPCSEAAYLGMRYVVEGAQLGNRVIHRHLQGAFGNGLREFGSFWVPDQSQQNSWPGLLNSLSRLESRDSLALAARAARLTFRHMEVFLAANEAGIP